MGGRDFISTPNIKKFAQEFFDCPMENFGALLEDEGGHGSINSHWAKNVFSDELMTSTPSPSGSRMTVVTLLLVKDSNFYDEVDVSMAEMPMFGYRGGCGFAVGVRSYKFEQSFCNNTRENDKDKPTKPCLDSDGHKYRY